VGKLNVIFKWALWITVFLCIVLISISCTSETPKQSVEKIIARIGNKTISVDEFVSRAELTVRPLYCQGDKEIHKKIILNSLIAEKLLALEAEKNNELSQNKRFQLHLKGRKEQAMRQWHYTHDFYEKVQLDSAEITMSYKLAGRKYDIAYFTMKDSAVVSQVQNQLQQGLSFAEVFQQLEGQAEIPRREVSWTSLEHEAIHSALFLESIIIGQVIGPVKSEKNFYTLIKILGWTDKKVLSDSAVQKRLNDVKKKLKERKAFAQFKEYISSIMRAKEIIFSEDVFCEVVNILGPYYMEVTQKNKLAFKQRYWKQGSASHKGNEIEINMSNIQDQPLLRIENKVWTVGDLKMELIAHPLVFRKKRIRKDEFAKQLQLAIADLIRDKYITQEAYKKGYDKLDKVQREVIMWRDHYYSEYQKEKYLKSLSNRERSSKDNMETIKQDLESYVNRLQEKHQDKIKINMEHFNDITLTSVNLMVLQENVPFPVVVPGFPHLTTNSELPD